MRTSKIKSYCKINLSLNVIKKLKNGYHNISSFITFCNLYDSILISKIKEKKDKIRFYGKFKKGINYKSNTIIKLLSLLRKKNLVKDVAFKIIVKKNIPHGSGLGGGSSNAANLLNYLNRSMKLNLNKKNLIKIGKKIGSDVPVCLEMKSAFLTGKNDKILRFSNSLKLNILLVYPNLFCSTKEVYAKNKKKSSLGGEYKVNNNNKKNLINYLKKENNDLEEVVIKMYPKIKNIIDFIKSRKGCYFSRITGSGSACIGIFAKPSDAVYAQKLVKLKYPKYWCVVSKTI